MKTRNRLLCLILVLTMLLSVMPMAGADGTATNELYYKETYGPGAENATAKSLNNHSMQVGNNIWFAPCLSDGTELTDGIFESSNTDIVTVEYDDRESTNILTAVGVGTATVTYTVETTVGTTVYSAEITVNPPDIYFSTSSDGGSMISGTYDYSGEDSKTFYLIVGNPCTITTTNGVTSNSDCVSCTITDAHLITCTVLDGATGVINLTITYTQTEPMNEAGGEVTQSITLTDGTLPLYMVSYGDSPVGYVVGTPVTSLSMTANSSMTYFFTKGDADTSQAVSVSSVVSDNPDVVAVSSATVNDVACWKLEAKSVGNATLTVTTSDNNVYSFTITVKLPDIYFSTSSAGGSMISGTYNYSGANSKTFYLIVGGPCTITTTNDVTSNSDYVSCTITDAHLITCTVSDDATGVINLTITYTQTEPMNEAGGEVSQSITLTDGSYNEQQLYYKETTGPGAGSDTVNSLDGYSMQVGNNIGFAPCSSVGTELTDGTFESSDTGVVTVAYDDMESTNILTAVGVGTATVTYTVGTTVYSAYITVVPPDIHFSTSATGGSANMIQGNYDYSVTKTFYLIVGGPCKVVGTTATSSSDFVTCTVTNSNLITCTVSNGATGIINLTITYTQTEPNFESGREVTQSITLTDGSYNELLYYKETMGPGAENATVKSLNNCLMSVGSNIGFAPYSSDEKELTGGTFASSDTDVVTVAYDDRACTNILTAVGVGTATVTYTVGTTVYSAYITVNLPDIYFSTSSDGGSMISGTYNYSGDNSKTFYLIVGGPCTVVEGTVTSNPEDVTCTRTSDNLITCTVSDNASGIINLTVSYNILAFGTNTESRTSSITLTDGTLPLYMVSYGDSPVGYVVGMPVTSLSMTANSFMTYFFTNGDADTSKAVSVSSVVSSDPDVVAVSSATVNNVACWKVEAKSVGNATLTVTTSDNKVYNFVVTVTMPPYWFASEQSTEPKYMLPINFRYRYGDDMPTVYLMSQNGFESAAAAEAVAVKFGIDMNDLIDASDNLTEAVQRGDSGVYDLKVTLPDSVERGCSVRAEAADGFFLASMLATAAYSEEFAVEHNGNTYVVGFGSYFGEILNIFGAGDGLNVKLGGASVESATEGTTQIQNPLNNKLKIYLTKQSVDGAGAIYHQEYTGTDITAEVTGYRIETVKNAGLISYDINNSGYMTVSHKTGPDSPTGAARIIADLEITCGGETIAQSVSMYVDVYDPVQEIVISAENLAEYEGDTPIERLEKALLTALNNYDSNPQATNLRVNLENTTYEGTITIGNGYTGNTVFGPPQEDFNTGIMLSLWGTSNKSESKRTTVYGGIDINNHLMDMRGISFVANSAIGSDQSGVTKALYNGGCLNSENCSFENYDVAMDATSAGHMTATRGNTFLNNEIAIKVNLEQGGDANRVAQYENNFYRNGIAIQLIDLDQWIGMYYYRMYDCNFIDNTVDYDVPATGEVFLYRNYYGSSNHEENHVDNDKVGYITGLVNAVMNSKKGSNVANHITGRPARVRNTTNATVNINPSWEYPVYEGVKYSNSLIDYPDNIVVANSTEDTGTEDILTQEEYEAANFLKLDSNITIVNTDADENAETSQKIDTAIINSKADELLIDEASFGSEVRTIHVVEGIESENETKHLGTWTFGKVSANAIAVVSNDTDSSAFNAKLTIVEKDEDSFTVTVENSDVLSTYQPTLTVPCAYAGAYVTCDGAEVASTVDTENETISFTVAKGGEYTIVKKFNIDGATMTLGNSLAINFFIEPDDLVADETYYAVITKKYADGRDDVTVRIDQVDWSYHNGYEQHYVTFNGVAAKEMTDELTVTVYNSADIAVSNVWVDSVRDYTMRMLSKETEAKKLPLYVDMLNYGAAAQTYFDYHVDDLANSKLTDTQKGYATKEVTMTDYRVQGTGYSASNLTLESDITLNVFFKQDYIDQTKYAVASFTDHYGNEKSVRVEGSAFKQLENDTDWYVPVKGLVVADVRQPVTVTVYNSDGTVSASCTDSIESYVARKSSENALYEAIMKFGVSAYAYFH